MAGVSSACARASTAGTCSSGPIAVLSSPSAATNAIRATRRHWGISSTRCRWSCRRSTGLICAWPGRSGRASRGCRTCRCSVSTCRARSRRTRWRCGVARCTFMGLPHTIVVNRAGKRFANEAFYRSVYFALGAIDGATQTHPNYPCWRDLRQPGAREVSVRFGDARRGTARGHGRSRRIRLPNWQRGSAWTRRGSPSTVARFNELRRVRAKIRIRDAAPACWGALDVRRSAATIRIANLGTVAKGPFHAVRLHQIRPEAAIAAAGMHGRAAVPGDRLGRRADRGALRRGQLGGADGHRRAMQSGVAERARHGARLPGRDAADKPSELLQAESGRGALEAGAGERA